MGFPPDRPPSKEDLAWLEALAGRPSKDMDPVDAREASLLAELIDEIGGPRESRLMLALGDASLDSTAFNAQDGFESAREEITPPPILKMSSPLIRYQRSSQQASSFTPPPTDEEPTPEGFARLLKRLVGKGLL
jgi:hypothetical protein